jgi:hypothetical protein
MPCFRYAMTLVAQCLFLTPVNALDFNTRDVEESGGWSSLIMELGSDRRSRAVVFAEDETSVMLAIDSAAGRCGSFTLALQITSDTSQAANQQLDNLFVQLRVDRLTQHTAIGTLNLTRGEAAGYIDIMPNSSQRLYSELQSGQYLRIKVTMPDKKSYISRFSLLGSRGALERQTTLCHMLTPDDDAYFEDPSSSRQAPSRPPERSNDEAYF